MMPMHYFAPETLTHFINGLAGSLAVDCRPQPTATLSAAALPEKPTLLVLPGY